MEDTFFFEKLSLFKYNDNLIFDKIKNFNKWDTIFPSDKQLNKVKLNDELIDEIFKLFHFIRLVKTSHPNIIIKNIYNAFFGKNIITAQHKDGKHSTNIISDNVRDMFQFGMTNLKIFIKDKPNKLIRQNVNIFDDDSDDDSLIIKE